jgi:hypothetical protein
LKIGQSVVDEKTAPRLEVMEGKAPKRQIAGKKNPKQLMEAWDLKMHKPWW